MDSTNQTSKNQLIKKLDFSHPLTRIFLVVLLVSIIAGISTGYILASTEHKSSVKLPLSQQEAPKSAQADASTFKDFAEGKIMKKPDSKDNTYSEGTHVLVRSGAPSVALTSSVVDLSKYEGKNVKVFGQTQKALKEGWLMDVGRVEEK